MRSILRFLILGLVPVIAVATVPETSNPVLSLRSNGWAANARRGTLTVGLPLGTIPGEIPVPIVYGVQGTFSVDTYKYRDPDEPTDVKFPTYRAAAVIRPAFGTIHFGFIRNAYTLPDGSQEPSITLLEDGQEYDGVVPFATAHDGVALKLPKAYGFAMPTSPMVDNGSAHLLYDTTAAGMGSAASAQVNAHLPSGFGAASTTYKVVMDASIARVFASVPALGGWVPVLWLDRFGHSVTFQWNRSTSNLPSGATALTTLVITNNHGRGAQLSWADWSDNTAIHDLVRVDFTGMSAPSMLVQGYAGTTGALPQGFPNIPPRYTSDGPGIVAPPSSTGGPIGRPTLVRKGDPNTVPQPLWQGSVIQPQIVASAGPSFSTQEWSLSWDASGESSHAALRSVTSPTGLTSVFTLAPYGPVTNPNEPFTNGGGSGVFGVSQVDDSDGSGAAHRITWNRSPAISTLPTTVAIQDSWPSIGAADRQWILTYPASGVGASDDVPSQTVLADASGNPLVTSVSALVFAGTDSLGTQAQQVTTTYASSVGAPNTQALYAFADNDNLQVSQVTNRVWNGSAFVNTSQSQETYAPRWDMLDGGDLTSTTLTRYSASGAAMLPVQTQTRVYDAPASGQVPQLQLMKSYQQVGAWQHGTALGYDSDGRPSSQSVYDSQDGGSTIAPSPNSTTLGYDSASGTLASATTSYTVPGASNGTLTQTQGGMDANGRPTTFTDAKGVVTTAAYDLLGRVIHVAKAGQAAMDIAWSGDGLTRTRTQNGLSETETYDGFGRLLKQTSPDGRSVEYFYDGDGRKASQTERAGVLTNPATGQAYPARQTDWSYDLLDRVTSETDPDTVTTNLSYAASGQNTVKDVVNATTGLKVEETDDPFGQAVKRQTFDGATSVKLATYAYDGMGHLIQVVETDPSGVAQTRTFTYDANGRLTSKSEPETGTQNFNAFNALGQPNSIAEGVQTPVSPQSGQTPMPLPPFRTRALVYDGLGRLVSQTNKADGLNYTYSGAFLTSASTTSNGWTVSQSFGYLPAANGALLQTETTTQPDFTATLQYSYDSNGRVASLTYPDGRVASYGYDALSRVNAVNQAPTGSASPVGVATAGYDPGWGYRSSLAFASGASSVWSTQADGIHLNKWSIQLPNGTKLDGDRLYNYDASKDNLSQAGEWSLVHDHLGRLVGASASSLGNYSATYGYDAFDNATSASVSGATPPQAIGFTFGALPLNRTPGTTTGGSATGWTYDAAGEATNFAAAPGSSSVTGLQWDGLGRMVQVNAPGLTEQEGYAPSGLRVRREESVASLSRRYVYTSGGLLLAEYVPKTGGGWQWNRDVVYLGSQAIAEVDGAGTHELHSDHLGTPRVITTASGGTSVIEGRQNYGPYGETFPAMDSGYQPLTGYTGHVQTDPTGLIYMRGRFYTPIWHRFVNSDQGADPSTWNQMAYVGGSPMMATDPTGLKERVVCDSGILLYEYTDDDGFTHTAIIGFCNSDGGGDGSYHLNSSAGDYGFSGGSDGSYVVNTSQVGVTNSNGSISWPGPTNMMIDYGNGQRNADALPQANTTAGILGGFIEGGSGQISSSGRALGLLVDAGKVEKFGKLGGELTGGIGTMLDLYGSITDPTNHPWGRTVLNSVFTTAGIWGGPIGLALSVGYFATDMILEHYGYGGVYGVLSAEDQIYSVAGPGAIVIPAPGWD